MGGTKIYIGGIACILLPLTTLTTRDDDNTMIVHIRLHWLTKSCGKTWRKTTELWTLVPLQNGGDPQKTSVRSHGILGGYGGHESIGIARARKQTTVIRSRIK